MKCISDTDTVYMATGHTFISDSLLNFKVICQRSRVMCVCVLTVFCVHDSAATRGQYLALSKAW